MNRKIYTLILLFALSGTLFDISAGRKHKSVQMKKCSEGQRNNKNKKKKSSTKEAERSNCCYDRECRECCELSAMGVTCITCATDCFYQGLISKFLCVSNPSDIALLGIWSSLFGAGSAFIVGIGAHGLNKVFEEMYGKKDN
jgi:hypothetical protein